MYDRPIQHAAGARQHAVRATATSQLAQAAWACQQLSPDIHSHGGILDGERLLPSCDPLATTSALSWGFVTGLALDFVSVCPEGT